MSNSSKTVYILSKNEYRYSDKDIKIIKDDIFSIFNDNDTLNFATDIDLNNAETLSKLLEQRKNTEDYLVIILEGGNYYWHGTEKFELFSKLLNEHINEDSWIVLANIIGKKIPESRIPDHPPAIPTDFDDLGINSRTKDLLEKLNINTAQDLANITEEQKLRLISIGKDEFDKLKLNYNDVLQKYDQMSISPDMPLEFLNISMRTLDCLLRAGYSKIQDLINSDGTKIIKIRNLGQKYYNEIADLMINRLKQPKEKWDYDTINQQL